MYATIPEDAEAMQPKNQAPARRGSGQIVVALCVGVIIGALGTIALIGGPEAPSPSRATMELDADADYRRKWYEGREAYDEHVCHDYACQRWC